MRLEIPQNILTKIYAHGESAYPEEGAGLLLGTYSKLERRVHTIVPLTNAREPETRHNRYLITPQDMLEGENIAARLGVDVIGVFHSHPDHPNQPSEFDREWAMPWFTYLITSVEKGRAVESKAWRLTDDRAGFEEEQIKVTELSSPYKYF
jgi:proteasome lid subunit RPN8/RPN11